jgi:drug/metabolite transporter (DMT)-like permease
MNSLSPATRASFWMVGSGLSFAAMAALVKLSAQAGVPFQQVVFYRGFIAFLVAWAVLRFRGEPLIGTHWRAQAVRGLIGIVGVFCYTAGVVLLPIASAVTLNYTSPLLLAAVMLMQARQIPPWPLVVALMGGFCGVVLMLQPSYDSAQWLGIAAALTSALTAVAAALHIRTLAKLRESAWRTVAWFSGCVAIAAFPGYLASHPGGLEWRAAVGVLAMGLTGALGQALLTLAYQRGHALTVSLLGYSQVVFTTLIGIVLWQDHPHLLSWLGIALIVGSGAMSTTFLGRLSVGKPPPK